MKWKRGRKPKTRMELLIEFLTDDNVKFLKNILAENQVVVYPFGTRLDETPQAIDRNGNPWDKTEWELLPATISDRFYSRVCRMKARRHCETATIGVEPMPVVSIGPRPGSRAEMMRARQWDAGADDTQILKENLAKLDRRIDVVRATIALGTNVPDSVTAAVGRESANMVEGVIVFSDGRSNLGSDSAFRELRSRATTEKIPIFTIAVGEDRQTSSIIITDIQADETMSPDDSTKIIVEADGINLANKSVDVALDPYYLGRESKDVDLKGLTPDFTFNATTSPTKTPYRITFILAIRRTAKSSSLSIPSSWLALRKVPGLLKNRKTQQSRSPC